MDNKSIFEIATGGPTEKVGLIGAATPQPKTFKYGFKYWLQSKVMGGNIVPFFTNHPEIYIIVMWVVFYSYSQCKIYW